MDTSFPGERGDRSRSRLALIRRSFAYLLLASLMTACGSGGSDDESSTASGPSAPIVSLTANPTSVPDNGFSTLTWSAQNHFTCDASGGWSGAKGASGTVTVGPLNASTVYILACRGVGGITTQAVTITVGNQPPPPAPTVSLMANPTSVGLNESTTLTWSSTNAASCEAFDDWSGTKATAGSETVGPLAATSTFTLVCSGAGGSAGQSVAVTVNAPPPPPVPTVSVTASPASVAYNGSSTLTWSSLNATSCTAAGAWSGSRATSGSEVRGPLTSTSTFILTCTGPGGSAGQSVTVAVDPPPAPTATLTANPTNVAMNGSATLTWTSSNATGCSASGAWSGTKAVNGSQSVGPLTQNSTFTLTCTGPGGSANRSVSVTVDPAALPTVTLTANPTTVNSGGSSVLTWTSSNATSCTAGGAWSGAKGLSGSQSVGPLTQDSTFTLTCTGPGGSTNVPVTVTVQAANGTADLTWVAPSTNEDGSALTLASFNIYKGSSQSNLQKIDSVAATQTDYTANGLPVGTHCFAVTAVSDTGAESVPSNVACKDIF